MKGSHKRISFPQGTPKPAVPGMETLMPTGIQKTTKYGGPSSSKGTRGMTGATGGKTGSGGGNITSQGDKGGGISAGRSRTMSGANRIGSGRQQTVRG